MAEASPASRSEQLEALRIVTDWRDVPGHKWRHQAEAVGFVQSYLARCARRIDPSQAALVRMPTATGKTGVIALIANFVAKNRAMLVVTPAAELVTQTVDRLNLGYWLDAVGKRPARIRRAAAFTPSTLRARIEDKPPILVCTHATMGLLLEPSRAPLYEALKEWSDLVMVDEGHREPARTWSRAIRRLGHPTVLVSATPYRNDLRVLRVGGLSNRHTLSIDTAQRRKLVRPVEIVSLKPRESETDATFVNALLRICKREDPGRESRVIVRCKSVDSIRRVARVLAKKVPEKQIAAIHHSFSGGGGEVQYEFESLPKDTQARFFIHQYKLLEGIDDARFRILAVRDDFANARNLVQQIGRIIRTRSGKTQRAVVICLAGSRVHADWKNYMAFERSERSSTGPEEIVACLQAALPEWFYAAGRYRSPTDLGNRQATIDALRVRASTQVFLQPEEFDREALLALAEDVSDGLLDNDYAEAARFEPEKGSDAPMVLLHWRVAPSPVLAEGGMFDFRLTSSVLYPHGGYLHFSGPLGLDSLCPHLNLRALSPPALERAVAAAEYRFTQFSTVNCDSGDHTVSRRALGGPALDETPPNLNDYYHFLSTCVASDPKSKRRRYVSMRRSRISDLERAPLQLSSYIEWLRTLSEELDRHSGDTGAEVLRRFADFVPAPSASQASHLLFELEGFFQDFAPSDFESDWEPPFADSFQVAACEVGDDGSFSCQIGDEAISGKVRYRGGRFRITSADLSKLFDRKEEADTTDTTRAETRLMRSGLRIVTADGLLYANHRFYSPRTYPWGKQGLANAGEVHGIEALAEANGEKGKRMKGSRWSKDSIFGVLDMEAALYEAVGWRPDFLLCLDGSLEAADFVAVSEAEPALALIHAKQLSGGLAAEKIQVVKAQAVKNLRYVNSALAFSEHLEKRLRAAWTNGSHKVQRIRKGPFGKSVPTRAEAIATVERIVRTPRTRREVWLALGDGFSKTALDAQLRGASETNLPAANVIQLAYLLQAANAAVGSVGARFRVLTSP